MYITQRQARGPETHPANPVGAMYRAVPHTFQLF